jgi:hypothetical protein
VGVSSISESAHLHFNYTTSSFRRRASSSASAPAMA